MIEENKELLADIEYYAGLMYTPFKIKLIIDLEVSETDVCPFTVIDHPIQRAYLRGRLKMEAEIRKSIFDWAKRGSSPAQSMAIKLIDESKLDEMMSR